MPQPFFLRNNRAKADTINKNITPNETSSSRPVAQKEGPLSRKFKLQPSGGAENQIEENHPIQQSRSPQLNHHSTQEHPIPLDVDNSEAGHEGLQPLESYNDQEKADITSCHDGQNAQEDTTFHKMPYEQTHQDQYAPNDAEVTQSNEQNKRTNKSFGKDPEEYAKGGDINSPEDENFEIPENFTETSKERLSQANSLKKRKAEVLEGLIKKLKQFHEDLNGIAQFAEQYIQNLHEEFSTQFDNNHEELTQQILSNNEMEARVKQAKTFLGSFTSQSQQT